MTHFILCPKLRLVGVVVVTAVQKGVSSVKATTGGLSEVAQLERNLLCRHKTRLTA